MAWLNATPKPDERSRRAQSASQAPTISRLERMKKDRIPVQMPPNPLPHVIDRLIDMGITEAAGMGVAPLSWQTLHAWQSVTGVVLPPWEARLIRQLSVAYVAEGRRAESENASPPWRTEITQRERDVEEARLQKLLG